MTEMTQSAPYPQVLDDLVRQCEYKDNWIFDLADIDRGQGSAGLTLQIHIACPDAYHPQEIRGVVHYFIVPAAAFDERSWRRWLFDRILDVETHEAMEFFQLDGERPYAPSHGPGNDPYLIREVGTDLDRRTSFRGDVNPERGPR
jgi:hypothetical protein